MSSCPINTTTNFVNRPSYGGYPFEATGCPTNYTYPPSWYYPATAGFEMPSKYASIFNRGGETPCPPTANTVVPPTGYPVMPPMTPTGYPVFPTERTWSTPFYPTERSWYNWPSSFYPTPSMTGFFNNWAAPWMNTNFPSTWFPSTTFDRFPMPSFFNNTPFANEWFNKPTWFNAEWSSINFRPTNPIEFYCLTNPIRILNRAGEREIYLCFDLKGYKPEEVNVTFNKTERCITVEATHDVKEGKEHHVTRKYFRKFVLPETLAKVDISKCEVKSCFTAEGMLVVEMPLPKMTTEELNKVSCPVTTRAFLNPYVSNPFAVCDTTCTTSPVNVKIC